MSSIDKTNESENLSRIRDILFGEDLQGIEQKLSEFRTSNEKILNEVSADFKSHLKELERQVKELSNKQIVESKKQEEGKKNINDQVEKKIETVNNQIKEEKKSFETELNKKISEIKKEMIDFQDSISERLDKLNSENQAKFKTLEETIISKGTLSSLLSELSDKLKND